MINVPAVLETLQREVPQLHVGRNLDDEEVYRHVWIDLVDVCIDETGGLLLTVEGKSRSVAFALSDAEAVLIVKRMLRYGGAFGQ